jgi:hypothetical protein
MCPLYQRFEDGSTTGAIEAEKVRTKPTSAKQRREDKEETKRMEREKKKPKHQKARKTRR